MRKNFPRFTLRISSALLDKIKYVADYHGRTKNKEIEYILKRQVAEFERLYGTIETRNHDEDL